MKANLSTAGPCVASKETLDFSDIKSGNLGR